MSLEDFLQLTPGDTDREQVNLPTPVLDIPSHADSKNIVFIYRLTGLEDFYYSHLVTSDRAEHPGHADSKYSIQYKHNN